MAHFAKIENGVVTNIIVVDNEHEANGEAYLNSIGLEGTWIQTSYNGNMRVKFAGVGDTYNQEKDRFEPSQPYPSWNWDESQYRWMPPVAVPEFGGHQWNEETLSWIEVSTKPPFLDESEEQGELDA